MGSPYERYKAEAIVWLYSMSCNSCDDAFRFPPLGYVSPRRVANRIQQIVDVLLIEFPKPASFIPSSVLFLVGMMGSEHIHTHVG